MATSTLGSGTLVLAGTTSGTTTVTATAVAGTTTLTLPAATDTLVGKATTDTLTNKTLTAPVVTTTIGVGAATPSASGAGITFPATQSASTDANTLDDYEEGTWTPSVGGTATYNTGNTKGFYTKIGRQVTINFSVQVTSLGTGAADRVINAPFACSSSINECAGSISYFDGLATSVVFIAPYIAGNTTQVGIVSTTAASTGVGYNNIFNTASGRIWATVTYFI
jgi:hypothetical protein